MVRKMMLDEIAKADIKELHKYYKLFTKLNGYKSSDDLFESYYAFDKNTDKKENFKMETAKLYDYNKLAQFDAESETIRMEENAPDVLQFLAYALNKHEENATMDYGHAEVHSKEVNEKALYTMFYMAVAAGYEMALEQK